MNYPANRAMFVFPAQVGTSAKHESWDLYYEYVLEYLSTY